MMLGCLLPAGAQSPKWSLDSCINYAVAHNNEVRQRMLAADQGELQVTEALDRVLPTLSGYGSENFSFGRGLTSDNTYANRNTSSFSVGAQLSLPLFQGLRAARNIKYSRTALKALLERTQETKDNVTVNVIVQYLQALYARESLGVARLKLRLSQTELTRREQLLEAGKIPELDLFEARAQVSQDELSVTTARNDSAIALLDLANLLNLDHAAPFDITPLADTYEPLPAVSEVWDNILLNNAGVKAGRIEEEAARQNIAVAQAGYIPTLSFSASLGTNYYRTSGFANEGFGAQMRHNFSKSLGFSLSVPLFDGFSTRNSVRRARLQLLTAQLSQEETQRNLLKTITTAHAQAVAAAKKEESAQAAVQSTEAAFKAMAVKYDNGRATATEYETARTNYTNSLSDCLQAHYEKILRLRILNFYNRKN